MIWFHTSIHRCVSFWCQESYTITWTLWRHISQITFFFFILLPIITIWTHLSQCKPKPSVVIVNNANNTPDCLWYAGWAQATVWCVRGNWSVGSDWLPVSMSRCPPLGVCGWLCVCMFLWLIKAWVSYKSKAICCQSTEPGARPVPGMWQLYPTGMDGYQ